MPKRESIETAGSVCAAIPCAVAEDDLFKVKELYKGPAIDGLNKKSA